MSSIVKNLLSLGLLLALIFFFRDTISSSWSVLYHQFLPCRSPIEYSIGTLDPEFGVSKTEFLEIIASAESVWEDAYGKELFVHVPDKGALKINMIYDYRQETTEKIEVIGSEVVETRASYDMLKTRHSALEREYLNAKKSYDSIATVFNQRQDTYSKEVDYWNSRGGAPSGKYEELNREEAALKIELERIRILERNLSTQVAEINKLVGEINTLARALNINVDTLNTIGESRGDEFTQGEYKTSHGGKEINIYEFSSETKLKRVIAHELGHALGIEHIEDPSAIMYYLNENTTGELSEGDISALKELCGT